MLFICYITRGVRKVRPCSSLTKETLARADAIVAEDRCITLRFLASDGSEPRKFSQHHAQRVRPVQALRKMGAPHAEGRAVPGKCADQLAVAADVC